MNKQEMCDLIEEQTGAPLDPKDHTKEDLAEMIEQITEKRVKQAQEDRVKQAQEKGALTPTGVDALRAPGGLTRRKMNRGSTRRLARAHRTIDDALEAFAKEIDMQVYMTDEEGNRVDACELVKMVGSVRKEVTTMMIDITAPAD